MKFFVLARHGKDFGLILSVQIDFTLLSEAVEFRVIKEV